MKSTVEELQNRCDKKGNKLYQFNVYDDKDEISRKWREQYKKLVSSKNNTSACIDVLREQFTFIENINRNILTHGLLTHDFEKEVAMEDGVEYIHYYIKEKKSKYNYFNDCDFFKGATHIYTGLTNLNLVNTRYDYFNDIRDSFRNVAAHNTKTVYYATNGKDDNELYVELYSIFNKLTDYLIYNQILDKKFIEESKTDILVKPGDKLQNGKYIIEKLISNKGGSSLVYLGKQSKLNDRKVAIKEYRIDVFEKSEQYESVINSEISNLDELSKGSLYIPNIIDRFFENGTNYVVMDYVPGINIDEYLNKYELVFDQVIKILKNLTSILQYLNQNNVAYNDIKSDNILIANNYKVYLVDLATEGIVTDNSIGVFRKEIIEFGKLIDRFIRKARLKQSEKDFLAILSDKCIIDDEFQTVDKIIEYLDKSVIRTTLLTKIRDFWMNPKKRVVGIVSISLVAVITFLVIYFLVGPPSYVREIKPNTVGMIIDDYKTNGKDCLELDIAVINRKWDYIKEGDIIHIDLLFKVDRESDLERISYSFAADKTIGHDKMKRYVCEITKKEFPQEYHIILGGFKKIMIDNIYIEHK